LGLTFHFASVPPLARLLRARSTPTVRIFWWGTDQADTERKAVALAKDGRKANGSQLWNQGLVEQALAAVKVGGARHHALRPLNRLKTWRS
jgi:hypothetical protein